VYDITDTDSFRKMSMWVKELRQQCGNQLPIVIVGNKSDLESHRQIKLADAEDYAKQLGVQHFSASARTGSNVKTIFKTLTERKSFLPLANLCAGIVLGKAANKQNRKLKTNTRGMINVQGIDIEDDENNRGFEIRGSEYKPKTKKKKCC